MYKLFKLLILVWLQNPLTQGAMIVYLKFLKPFANKYKVQIGELHDFLQGSLQSMGDVFVVKEEDYKHKKDKLLAAKSMFENPTSFIKNAVPEEYKGLVDQAESGL